MNARLQKQRKLRGQAAVGNKYERQIQIQEKHRGRAVLSVEHERKDTATKEKARPSSCSRQTEVPGWRIRAAVMADEAVPALSTKQRGAGVAAPAEGMRLEIDKSQILATLDFHSKSSVLIILGMLRIWSYPRMHRLS
ncbi:hypothetical protein PoB_000215000 [Plakobranchus ocellatus]|uniref:Uncharacterized protein n=1 Tax=Plakobranchus ocellatus TaxID=259542 RepID=A0AAV3XYE7_9GAST|nr:hypothetical protein PoB_000215000 [Plakobranchus ocellatus]